MNHKFSGKEIDTVIFDLGGVLIDWNPKYLYKNIFNTDESVNYFLENVCTSDWNEEQDGGRPVAVGNEILFRKYPEYRYEIEVFYSRWPEMLGGPIHDTVDILKKVKENKNIKLVALTNWSAETFPVARKGYEFLTWFDDILVSGEEMLKKPDPAIYNLLVSKFNLDKSTSIFIDDNKRNILAAENLGIHSIHFVSASDLKSRLINLL